MPTENQNVKNTQFTNFNSNFKSHKQISIHGYDYCQNTIFTMKTFWCCFKFHKTALFWLFYIHIHISIDQLVDLQNKLMTVPDFCVFLLILAKQTKDYLEIHAPSPLFIGLPKLFCNHCSCICVFVTHSYGGYRGNKIWKITQPLLFFTGLPTILL